MNKLLYFIKLLFAVFMALFGSALVIAIFYSAAEQMDRSFLQIAFSFCFGLLMIFGGYELFSSGGDDE